MEATNNSHPRKIKRRILRSVRVQTTNLKTGWRILIKRRRIINPEKWKIPAAHFTRKTVERRTHQLDVKLNLVHGS